MRRLFLILLGLSAGFVAGCGQKEVTPLQRKQGASLVSEANFAVTIRDYPRAEGLFVQAVAVCPDAADYWLGLGAVRRKLDNRAGSRTAYEQALTASRAGYKRDPANAQLLLQQVYVLALLGRVDDARAALEQARKSHPENRNIRAFAEGHELDRLLADPGFQDRVP